MTYLPAHQHTADCGCYPHTTSTPAVYQPVPLPDQIRQQTTPQVIHVHQAPPDRTVQRVALGSGVGAGAVAAGVYFGPLLVGALSAIAIDLGVVAFVIVAVAWGVVTLVRSVGGEEGQNAAKALGNARSRKRR